MAYVKDDFMMKSIAQPADDDVILIQSDDDTESDDVVLVSDSDSRDCPRLPNNHKKPHKKRSRRRRKKLHPLCDVSESTEFHNRFSVSNHLDFSSEVNFYAQPSSVKETTKKALNHSLFLTDRGHSQKVKPLHEGFRNDDCSSVEHELYYSAPTDTSISHQGSAHMLPNTESASAFYENSHMTEKVPSDLPAIAGLEFADKANVAESGGEVVTQDESISRDEMASLADVDVSLLSNISFCSDLSNDLPGDLPSTLASELAIDLVNDFNSLESELEMGKAAGSLECDLSLGTMGNCLRIASYSKHALDGCSEGNPPSVTYHFEADNPRISANLLEAENLCNFANVDGNSCSIRVDPCAAESSCDMGDAVPVLNGNLLSSTNICDLENIAGNSYKIRNSHLTGNLLEMGIFPELGNSLEIGSLSAMDSLQEFQNLPEMETEELYLEDKDLEVDLSSTFIKDVLNLNVGETISDPLAEPLNFSTIVSAFDSLISAAPHLVLSSTSPVTVAQHPLMSSASSVVQNLPLISESSLSFESQHHVLSSDANSVPHSLLTCASSASVAHPHHLSSSVSFAQHTEASSVPLLHPPLSSDCSASLTVQPQLSPTLYVEQHLLPSTFFSPDLEFEEDAGRINVAQEGAGELQLQPISREQMDDLLMKSDAAALDDEVSSVDDKGDADSIDLLAEETSSCSLCSPVASPPRPGFVGSEDQMATDRDPSTENSASALHKNPVVSESSFPVPSASIPLVKDSVSIPSVSSPVTKTFDNKNGNDEYLKKVVSDTSDSLSVYGDTDSFKAYQCSPAKSSFHNKYHRRKMLTNLKNGLGFLNFSSRAQKTDELAFGTLDNQNSSLTESCCPPLTDEITTKNENYLPSSLMMSLSSGESNKSVGMLDLKAKEDNTGQCFHSEFRLGKRPRKESTGTADEPLIELAWKKVRLDEEGANEEQFLTDEVYEEKEELEESCDIVADNIGSGDRTENVNEECDEFEEENGDLNEGFQDISNESEDLEETNLCLSDEVHDLVGKEQVLVEENLDFTKELEDTNQENLDFTEDLEETNQENLDFTEDLEGTNQENLDFTKELEDTNQENLDFTEELEETNQENLDFTEELEDTNQENLDFTEELEETNQENLDFTQELQETNQENLDFTEELEETNLVINERLTEVEDLDEAVLVNDENLIQEEDGIELEGTIVDLNKEPQDPSKESKISEVENLALNAEIDDPGRVIEGLNGDDLDMSDTSQNISKGSYSLKSRNVNTNDEWLHRDINSYEHLKENLELNVKNCGVDKENMVIRSQNKSDLDCNYNHLNGRSYRPKAPSSPRAALGCESDNNRSVVDVIVNKETVDVLKAKCFNCLMEIAKSVLAYCTAGHGCCSACLHGQVKAFLATSSKSPFSCQFQGCNSFYLISQLRSSLPKMVVDILEAKLEREYSDSTAQLLKKVNGIREMNTDTDEEQDDTGPVHYPGTSLPSEICATKDAFELPLHWKETKKNEYQLIDVTANSDEFAEVSALFHRTMLKSRATILRLQRLQNPVLWEFYTVKKKQKEMEGVDKRSFERLLFHGIRREFVDTICLNNFDWRTCGVSHGIMYGQGTYFARDASYAHRYTDRNPNSINKSCSAHLNITMTSDDTTPALQVDDGNISLVSPSDTLSFDPEAQVISKSSSELPAPTNVAFDDWERHAHLMFLARVIVGRYTRGKRTYRKPPAIDLFVPYGKCYDSCVNYVDDPTLFVIFDSSQYYPEYLIHYTNRPKMSS